VVRAGLVGTFGALPASPSWPYLCRGAIHPRRCLGESPRLFRSGWRTRAPGQFTE